MTRKVLTRRIVVRTINPAWLRERRAQRAISLRELARRIGVSAPYLSDVELGRRPIGPGGKVVRAYEAL